MKRGRRLTVTSSVLAALLLWCGPALCGETLESTLALIAEKRYLEARRALDPQLMREPSHPRLRLVHGILRMREGFPGEAIDIFRDLQRDHPPVFEAANNLAVVYAMQGRLDDARDTLLAALKRWSEPLLYANLGDVYMQLAQRAYANARGVKAGQETARPTTESTDRVEVPPEPPARPHRDTTTEPATRIPSSDHGIGASVLQGGFECVRAAGFENRAAAEQAADWLRSQGTKVVGPYHEERREIKTYRIYVPPLSSREEATAMVRKIRGQGLRDVALINRGALANGISLGVYRREPNMRRRFADLEKKGISVRFAEETKSVRNGAWAIESRAVRDRDALNAAWASNFPGRPLESVVCG